MAKASALTGISKARLKSDDVANVCGGAAVLAQYQREAGGARDLGDWSASVARYSGADDQATALRFATEVFRVIRQGEARTTNDGQRMVLAPHSGARVDVEAVKGLRSDGRRVPAMADCPAKLGCEWYPAPYEQYGPGAGDYGNHDLADRPNDRPRHRLHRHARHRGDLRHHAPARERPRRTSRGTTRSGPPTGTSPSTLPTTRRLARRQLVREHALDRRRAGGLRGRRRRSGTPSRSTATPPELVALPRRASTASRSTARTSSATTRCRASCPATWPGCTGTRARSGTGSTTSSCWARPSRPPRARAARRHREARASTTTSSPVTGCVPGQPRRRRAGRRGRTSSTCTPLPDADLAARDRHRPQAGRLSVDDVRLRHRCARRGRPAARGRGGPG